MTDETTTPEADIPVESEAEWLAQIGALSVPASCTECDHTWDMGVDRVIYVAKGETEETRCPNCRAVLDYLLSGFAINPDTHL